ncbi:MAG TPA: hypothetical protein VKV24_18660 [Casimicrobiaceae bacterium]|nr:hypothetical protein [Casimicrobiaceae bacterium]
MAQNASADSQSEHPSPGRHKVALATLVFGAAAAPLAWNLHLLISVGFTSHACFPGREPLGAPFISGIWWIPFGIGIAGIVIGIVSALVALHAWRKTRTERPGRAHELMSSGDGRTRFVAMCGILTSGLFIVALIFAMLAVFLAPICEL